MSRATVFGDVPGKQRTGKVVKTHGVRLRDGVDKLPQVFDLGQQLLLRQLGVAIPLDEAVEVSEVLLDGEGDVVRRGQLGRDLLEERLVLCPMQYGNGYN